MSDGSDVNRVKLLLKNTQGLLGASSTPSQIQLLVSFLEEKTSDMPWTERLEYFYALINDLRAQHAINQDVAAAVGRRFVPGATAAKGPDADRGIVPYPAPDRAPARLPLAAPGMLAQQNWLLSCQMLLMQQQSQRACFQTMLANNNNNNNNICNQALRSVWAGAATRGVGAEFAIPPAFDTKDVNKDTSSIAVKTVKNNEWVPIKGAPVIPLNEKQNISGGRITVALAGIPVTMAGIPVALDGPDNEADVVECVGNWLLDKTDYSRQKEGSRIYGCKCKGSAKVKAMHMPVGWLLMSNRGGTHCMVKVGKTDPLDPVKLQMLNEIVEADWSIHHSTACTELSRRCGSDFGPSSGSKYFRQVRQVRTRVKYLKSKRSKSLAKVGTLKDSVCLTQSKRQDGFQEGEQPHFSQQAPTPKPFGPSSQVLDLEIVELANASMPPPESPKDLGKMKEEYSEELRERDECHHQEREKLEVETTVTDPSRRERRHLFHHARTSKHFGPSSQVLDLEIVVEPAIAWQSPRGRGRSADSKPRKCLSGNPNPAESPVPVHPNSLVCKRSSHRSYLHGSGSRSAVKPPVAKKPRIVIESTGSDSDSVISSNNL
jgi:hypothetical protein